MSPLTEPSLSSSEILLLLNIGRTLLLFILSSQIRLVARCRALTPPSHEALSPDRARPTPQAARPEFVPPPPPPPPRRCCGLSWRADPSGFRLVSRIAVPLVTEQFSLQEYRIITEGGRMDQTCMAAISNQPLVADVEPVKKTGGDMPVTTGGGCFDCNICLDFAAEPVVTLCGHLYCWPCIYEWLCPGVESTASDTSSSARRQCPVCKAKLSRDTLVPLYGRGGNSKKSLNGLVIPRRPKVHRETVEHQNSQSHVNDHDHRYMEVDPPQRPIQHTHHHSSATEFDFIYPPAPLGRGLIHSTAGGVLGGMAEAVLPWAFRGQLPPSLYYTSPYYVAAQNGRPRLRRQELEIERSLHQIWFFLFVFVVLCLLLF